MDMSEYKDEFISEAKTHLDNLNEKLLEIEKAPDDLEIMNSIFRSCHTLKGNAATMGFNKFSVLAHDMENVLDNARNKKLELDSSVIDTLFKACDFLEEGLNKIDADQADSLDASEIIAELNKISPNEKKNASEHKVQETVHLTDIENKKVAEFKEKGFTIHRIVVMMQDNPLKGAKGSLLLKKALQKGEIINVNPSEDLIKSGKYGTEIDLVMATKEDPETLQKELNGVSKVEDVKLLSLDEKLELSSNNSGAAPSSNHPGDTKSDPLVVDSKIATPATPATPKVENSIKKEYLKEVQEIKIDVKKLDNLQNMIGELLINKMRIEEINSRYSIKELSTVLKTMDILTTNIQNEVIDERMLPIDQTFNRFPRMVRDLARKQGKQIDFETSGGDNKLDRTVIDNIGDPLVHILRNSVDHGIETPEERVKSGKSETGTIKLSARREKSYVVIEITDDGAGINIEKLKKKAISKNLITQEEADKMTDQQAAKLIFKAGLSTNEVITDVSGRGVGMDVVETKIKEVNGFVDLQTEVGKGTTLLLKLPLTMAIITVLLIKCAGETYAIPLSSIDQTMDVKKSEIKTIQGREVFILRGRDLAILRLHDLISKDRSDMDEYVMVIVENQGERVGLIVDEIICQQQILIKTVNDRIKKVKGLSGATILGDGTVCFIIDMGSLIRN